MASFMNRRRFLAGAAASAALLGPAMRSATAQGTGLAQLAAMTGPDRLEKLVEGAKKEGRLSIYTSQRQEDITAVGQAFKAKYGIDVSMWRANSDVMLQRAVAEYRAGRFEADVYETSNGALEAMHREGMLQKVDSAVFADLLPQALRPHREWVGTRLNIITPAANTNAVPLSNAPKTWTDFLDPKWKGMIGVEADDADWFAEVVRTFPSEQEGLDFFRKLVAQNGLSVRKGHALLVELVAAGEIPLAMTVYQYQADDLKQKGAPVEWIRVRPAIGRVNGVAVSNKAPHPHAALLFFEFILGEGQKIYADRAYTPTNIKVKPLPAGLDLTLVDPEQVLDESAKWQKLFTEIVLNQSRAP